MPDFCIGTAQFGMDYGVANTTGQLNQSEIDLIVKYAIENNFEYFDTAQSYGNSEITLGLALEKIKRPNDVKVISKLSPILKKKNKDNIVQSVRLSIELLNISHLYGFMAHSLKDFYSKSFLSAMDILKEKGLIVKGGVSVYTPDEAIKALKNPELEILQIPFNLLDRRWLDLEIFKKAEEKNIQLFLRSIFLQGLIFLENGELKERGFSWACPLLNRYREILKNFSISPIELTFGILSKIPGENVIVMGLDSFQQMQTNINAINSTKINSDVAESWWKQIPEFPEKLLNPALWN